MSRSWRQVAARILHGYFSSTHNDDQQSRHFGTAKSEPNEGAVADCYTCRSIEDQCVAGAAKYDWSGRAADRRLRYGHAAGRAGGGERRVERVVFRRQRSIRAASQAHADFHGVVLERGAVGWIDGSQQYRRGDGGDGVGVRGRDAGFTGNNCRGCGSDQHGGAGARRVRDGRQNAFPTWIGSRVSWKTS